MKCEKCMQYAYLLYLFSLINRPKHMYMFRECVDAEFILQMINNYFIRYCTRIKFSCIDGIDYKYNFIYTCTCKYLLIQEKSNDANCSWLMYKFLPTVPLIKYINEFWISNLIDITS